MEKTKIIAEIAQAHDGDLNILHSYIDALASTGVDIVKFQIHIAEKESSPYEKFRVPAKHKDKTRFDYWKRMEFTREEWISVKRHCEEKGLEFFASPFSLEAVRLLDGIGIKRYKVASGEIDNFLMLNCIRKTGKEIWISTGLATYSEIEKTLKFLDYPKEKIALFQCTTDYPTKPHEIGLNVIGELSGRFGVRVGLSDHSGYIFPSLAAVTLGVELIECHVVFDKNMPLPDSNSSLIIDEFRTLVKGVRFIENAMRHPVDKNNTEGYKELKSLFGKSLVLNKDLKMGDIINLVDLEDRKPGNMGIPAKLYQDVVGRKLKVNLREGSFIKEDNVEV